MTRKWLPFLFVFFSLLSFPSCSTLSPNDSDPAVLMKEAEEDIESEHYQIAIDKLRTLKNKFPYSKYATDAQLRIADVYFLQESWSEAALSYEAFRDLHPKHEKAPYALFRAGKSYYNDIPSTIARDMTPASKSLDTYNDFIKKFPSAPESVEANKDITHIRNLLAEKQLYIAEFYFKRDFFESSKPRYEKIIELYPETESAKIAHKRLEELNQKLTVEEPKKNGRTDGQPQAGG